MFSICTFFLLFHILCSLIIIIHVYSQNNLTIKIDAPYLEQFLELQNSQPEVGNSCLVRQVNASQDFYIICPTTETCLIKHFSWKSRPAFLQITNNAEVERCEPIAEGNPLPANKVDQLNAVLRVIKSSVKQTTPCNDEFRFVRNLQAVSDNGLNLEQLSKCNCPTNHTDEVDAQCPYNLEFLDLNRINLEFLSNNSFCGFKQLEILKMVGCNLRWMEEDALVLLVKLKMLTLSENELTHLPQNLFRGNANLQLVDLRNNRIQFLGLRVFYALPRLQILYLSDNCLQTLDDPLAFSSNVKRLIIENNEIRLLGLGLTNLVNLTQLYMSNNSLEEVTENAFQNLKFVKIFSLAFNKIQQLHKNTFKSNLCLERINLRWNQLRDIPPIGHLTNLKVFLVGGNKIGSIGKSDLVNCSQLSYLDLSQNRLSFIEEDAFDNVRQLETLDLSHNQLSQKSSNLKPSYIILTLDLDYNNFTSFSFQDFPPSVKQLSLRFNQIEAIETLNFQGQQLQQRNLTSLNLSNNFLVSIEHLQLPPSIQSVNFSSNRIHKLMSPSDVQLQPLSQLRIVDLQNNNITLLCENVFDVFEESRQKTIYYYVSLNPLKCTCDLVWIKKLRKKRYGIKFLDLDNIYCENMFNAYQPLSGLNLLQLTKSPKSFFLCVTNHEKSNRCECPQYSEMQCTVQLCPYNCTCLSDFAFNYLFITCVNRQFRQIPSRIKYNDVYSYTKTLFDFSRNSISHLGHINFENNLDTQMMTLVLRASNIESIEDNAFDKLIRLFHLDLSHNRLQTMPKGLFDKLTQLTTLSLLNNQLLHLDDKTFNSILSNLQYLYLNDNGLKQLGLEQIRELKSLRNVTLQHNPWSCECMFIKSFKALLITSSTPFHRKLELNCTEEEKNGKELNVANFNTDHCVQSQIHLTIIIASLTIILVLVICTWLVLKWHYELRVLVYAHYGLRLVHHPEEEEVEGKQYDAFMVYNNEDEDFVVTQLMPGLEAIANPYRLCIYDRDFPVGAVILDCILEAIDMSSRIIILLSENYVRSEWGPYQFKNAHMKMLHDRCPRLLVILLGEVPETLDPEMKLYLKTNTYLKWGEKLFWQKLYYAMPDKRVTTPATDIMPMSEL